MSSAHRNEVLRRARSGATAFSIAILAAAGCSSKHTPTTVTMSPRAGSANESPTDSGTTVPPDAGSGDSGARASHGNDAAVPVADASLPRPCGVVSCPVPSKCDSVKGLCVCPPGLRFTDVGGGHSPCIGSNDGGTSFAEDAGDQLDGSST